MFRKEYQGGPYVDVFSAQGRDPAAQWKLTGSVRKVFDKEVRGYVYTLEGGTSTTTTRMKLPKSDKGSLCLLQPCCMLQLMVPDTAKLTIDLSILDEGGIRRRINLSSSQRELSATPLNARVPLGDLVTGQWVNLCVDMASLVESLFKGSRFKSLEGISLGGSCQLRRIFTLQSTPTSAEEGWAVLPRAFHITSVPTKTQIVSFKTWAALTESKFASQSDVASEHSSQGHPTSQGRPTHVAFGKKVVIPDHILTARQVSRQEGEDVRVRGGVQPRPPSHPADQSLLRIQRTRVRMVSERKSGTRKIKETGADYNSATKGSTHQNITQDIALNTVQNAPDAEYADSILSSDEQLAVEALRQSHAGLISTREAEETTSEEQVYSYRSAPKSAESRVPSVQEPEDGKSGRAQSRGARLEEDFLTPTTPLSGGDQGLGNTRLSDDYDWRQYASADGDEDQSAEEHSLRTRLASHPPTHSPATLPDTGSTACEDTLSGSMTLNGLEEHLQNMTQSSLLDSLETRGMGGMLSPALLDTGQGVIEETDTAHDHSNKADELELMYDPQLNCFYDPVTCKYYELIQSD